MIHNPKNLVKIASKRGIKVIAVTDHNSLKGGLLTSEEVRNSEAKILVVNGAEIPSDCRHVLALFVQNEIKSRNNAEIMDEIRDQDGLVIIPHPTEKSQKFTEKELLSADLLRAQMIEQQEKQVGTKFSKSVWFRRRRQQRFSFTF